MSKAIVEERIARTRARVLATLGLVGALGIAGACSAGGEEGLGRASKGRGQGGAAATDGGANAGGSGALNLDPTQADVASLKIEPASAVIDITNGTGQPLQFKAVATFAKGGAGEVTAEWAFDREDLATIGKSAGLLTAHGIKAGKGIVTATVGGVSATAEAIIKIHMEDNPAGLGQPQKDAFNAPDATPSGTLQYPYDGTVFGRGILAPEMMWTGGTAGDVYRIRITDQNVDLTTYTFVDPPSRWTMPNEWWRALSESSDGSPITAQVQRMSGSGQAHAPVAQNWRIAPGSLRGTIYYWAVNQGTIVKINPGASAPVRAFDSGPYDQLGTPAPVSGYTGKSPPWENQGSGQRCVACHTVSRDGSTLAAAFHTGSGYPWGSVDTKSEAISVISDYTTPSVYSALTPEGSRLVFDRLDLKMGFADAKTGQPLPSLLDSFTQVAHPQFSHDGKMLAFAGSVTGGNPIEFKTSNLDVVDYDAATGTFSNRRTIVSGGGEEIAFPSFTPDNNWIIFQKGDYSRASYGNPLQTGHNDLYMVNVAPGSQPIHLGRASGAGALMPKDLRRSYQARVNPVSVGGYFWVVFVSPRDYGNRMQSTNDSTTENRKQLWVTAIDANPQPGADPSHPPFWLPGQDISTINMDGYWALEPCKQEGNSCNEGYECCTGFCRDQGDGSFLCAPPSGCSQIAEKCTTDADCCDPAARCIGGFCAQPGPA